MSAVSIFSVSSEMLRGKSDHVRRRFRMFPALLLICFSEDSLGSSVGGILSLSSRQRFPPARSKVATIKLRQPPDSMLVGHPRFTVLNYLNWRHDTSSINFLYPLKSIEFHRLKTLQTSQGISRYLCDATKASRRHCCSKVGVP